MQPSSVLAGPKFSLLHRLRDSSYGTWYMRYRRAYRPYRVNPETALVVDGFPRSANTYAWYALKGTLEPERVVSGHTHAASTIIEAVGRDLPTMVIIRHPDDAVSSLVQLAYGVSIERAFRAYSGFYTKCSEVLSFAVLVDFNDVVTRLPRVVDTVYRRYNLDWPRYMGTIEDEARVRFEIDEASRRRRGGKIREAGVARPSPHRKSADRVLSNLSAAQSVARQKALRVYEDCMQRYAVALDT